LTYSNNNEYKKRSQSKYISIGVGALHVILTKTRLLESPIYNSKVYKRAFIQLTPCMTLNWSYVISFRPILHGFMHSRLKNGSEAAGLPKPFPFAAMTMYVSLIRGRFGIV